LNSSPISVGDLMGEIMFGLQKHSMLMNGAIASTLLTISISEGLIRSLDPSFDMITKSWPYILQYSNSDLLTATATVAGHKIQDDVDKKIDKSVKDLEIVIEKGEEIAKEVGHAVEEIEKEVEIAIEKGKEVVNEKTDQVRVKIDTIRRRATGTLNPSMKVVVKDKGEER
jgi:predicted unusual protein kinase regulating ubiquinone biosynthesis (AarF/ABC1/UbiB family)